MQTAARQFIHTCIHTYIIYIYIYINISTPSTDVICRDDELLWVVPHQGKHHKVPVDGFDEEERVVIFRPPNLHSRSFNFVSCERETAKQNYWSTAFDISFETNADLPKKFCLHCGPQNDLRVEFGTVK